MTDQTIFNPQPSIDESAETTNKEPPIEQSARKPNPKIHPRPNECDFLPEMIGIGGGWSY